VIFTKESTPLDFSKEDSSAEAGKPAVILEYSELKIHFL